jgi:hypothetical protein
MCYAKTDHILEKPQPLVAARRRPRFALCNTEGRRPAQSEKVDEGRTTDKEDVRPLGLYRRSSDETLSGPNLEDPASGNMRTANGSIHLLEGCFFFSVTVCNLWSATAALDW